MIGWVIGTTNGIGIKQLSTELVNNQSKCRTIVHQIASIPLPADLDGQDASIWADRPGTCMRLENAASHQSIYIEGSLMQYCIINVFVFRHLP